MRISKLMTMVLAAASMALCGCLEAESVLLIRPDGSGTITEKMLMGQMASQMMAMGDAEDGEQLDPLKAKISKKELAKRASALGEGVTVQSAKVITAEDGRRGVEVVYAFPDANKIKLSLMQSLDAGSGPGGAGAVCGGGACKVEVGAKSPDVAEEAEDKQEQAKLVFTKAAGGKPATLTVILPQPKKGEGKGKPEAEVAPEPNKAAKDPQAKAMMKMMFAGMRLSLSVKTEGKIVKTNATYPASDEKGLTLYDFNFGKLVLDEKAFAKMDSMEDDMSFEDAKKQFSDPLLSKYLRLETKPRVEVQFE